MKFVVSLFGTYWKSARFASKNLLRGWMIIPATALVLFLFQYIYGFIATLQLGLAGGFILGMTQLAIITLVYQWLILAREPRAPKPEEYVQFDGGLFISILNAAFPIFIAEILLHSMVGNITELATVPVYLKLAIVFLMNPLPEIIIVDRPDGLSALASAFDFVKTHLIEWFLPLLLIAAPTLLLLTPVEWFQMIVVSLAGSEVLLPIELLQEHCVRLLAFATVPFSENPSSGIIGQLAFWVIGLIGACWLSLFRLELFESLRRSPLK